jgi:hypothetical protein
MLGNCLTIVMSRLVPGTHVVAQKDVDGRDKPGHDGGEAVCP